jgi:Outer membrane lipoprotein-sorting protein
MNKQGSEVEVYLFPSRERSILRRSLTGLLAGVVCIGLGAGSVFANPSKPPVPEDEMVSRYMDATQQQQTALRGGTMEVDINANVPNMKTHGKLHALKSISKLGKITYHALGFSGDNSVKTEVIARYLKAEVDAAQDGQNFSVTPANYKFKYKGMEARAGRDVYVLHVTPRQKKVGLFKGELWVDAQTYLPVRESGSFVKTPSIFLKKMQFVRDYDIQNGVAVPQRMESKADVRFIGPVELSVDYFKFSKEEPDTAAAGVSDPQQ